MLMRLGTFMLAQLNFCWLFDQVACNNFWMLDSRFFGSKLFVFSLILSDLK